MTVRVHIQSQPTAVCLTLAKEKPYISVFVGGDLDLWQSTVTPKDMQRLNCGDILFVQRACWRSLHPVCTPENSLKIAPPAIVTLVTCLNVPLSMWHHITPLCPPLIPRQPTQSKCQPTCPRTLKQHCATDTCSKQTVFLNVWHHAYITHHHVIMPTAEWHARFFSFKQAHTILVSCCGVATTVKCILRVCLWRRMFMNTLEWLALILR